MLGYDTNSSLYHIHVSSREIFFLIKNRKSRIIACKKNCYPPILFQHSKISYFIKNYLFEWRNYEIRKIRIPGIWRSSTSKSRIYQSRDWKISNFFSFEILEVTRFRQRNFNFREFSELSILASIDFTHIYLNISWK